MENMEICSSRITIRPYEISDADDFLVYAGDDSVTQFHRWATFKSTEEACTYIKESCIPHPFCRSICLDNRSIGYVKVHPWSGNDRCKADTSYAIASKYWGQGIATRAVKMAIDQALKEFPEVMRVQGTVEVENMASQKLLERLGFVREGLMRKFTYNKGVVKDIVMFSLVI